MRTQQNFQAHKRVLLDPFVCELDDTFSLTNIDNGNQIHSGEMNVIGLQTHQDNRIPIEK